MNVCIFIGNAKPCVENWWQEGLLPLTAVANIYQHGVCVCYPVYAIFQGILTAINSIINPIYRWGD